MTTPHRKIVSTRRLAAIAGCVLGVSGLCGARVWAQPGDPEPFPQKPDPNPPQHPPGTSPGQQPAPQPGGTPAPEQPRPGDKDPGIDGPAGVGPAAPQPEVQPVDEDIDPHIAPFENRLVREVRLLGLKREPERLVRNQVRTKAGNPLNAALIREDVKRLNRLGRFREIRARLEPFSDQSVAVIYELVETPIVTDVQAVGNRQLSDADIAAEINILADNPVDEYSLGRAARRIQELYRKKGYYLAEVEVDRKELDESGIVLFRIRERERVKVRDIRFDGNNAFDGDQIRSDVKTKVAGWFETGPLDNDVLEADVAAIVNFYKDRGYLDVRADREIRISPDSREAIVTFQIDEGRLYTLRSVRVQFLDDLPSVPPEPDAEDVALRLAQERELTGDGKPVTPGEIDARLAELRADRDSLLEQQRERDAARVFTIEQLKGLMLIKTGDAYSINRINESLVALRNAYGHMGYVDVFLEKAELRDEQEPKVDLLLRIAEGKRYMTGLVKLKGNTLTQQQVIRRHFEVKPMRPLSTPAMAETKKRLDDLRLFEGSGQGENSSVKLTFQAENPERPGERDVLVESKETNTGSLGFGVGVTSDAGLVGQINLNQRNFDITDTPDSFSEMINGRAFRGAGQTFNLSIQPGTEVQDYSVSLTEPYLFESDYSGTVGAYYRLREYDEYDEQRIGSSVSVGRRFGERWVASLGVRVAEIELSNIEEYAPVDVFAVEDPHLLTGLGLGVTRTTVDSRYHPTKGTRFELGIEQVGALGGDFNFTKISAEHTVFLPVYEDFLGRTTILSLKTSANYIPQDVDDVPVYERYYLGGRSLRGFRFREVSPKGIRNDTGLQGDDPVGGTWAFFFGPEIEQPLFERIVSGVAFVDSGTVVNDVGFDSYRVSVGVGVRLYIPQFGPVPLAFDLAYPLLKEDGDDTRYFSFSVDLPY
ncbi:MAG: BamA/TamA family outer membrane protein [Phycisphaerales bacterium]|nr:BamA/TamA family outer membrane protein [Phycisphaerales bacterium]